jgi:hypothetical protein
MLFLGDTHGKKIDLSKIVDIHPNIHNETIYCVGDCGVGFPNFIPEIPSNVKFIAGNHDNRKLCPTQFPNQYLGDYGYIEELDLFFVSGAWSIDKKYRTEDVDWWSWEELNYAETSDMIQLYSQVKPSNLLTHDFPTSVIPTLFGYEGIKNHTGSMLDHMFQTWKVKQHIAGHHHFSVQKNILGTQFTCLAELELRYVELYNKNR